VQRPKALVRVARDNDDAVTVLTELLTGRAARLDLLWALGRFHDRLKVPVPLLHPQDRVLGKAPLAQALRWTNDIPAGSALKWLLLRRFHSNSGWADDWSMRASIIPISTDVTDGERAWFWSHVAPGEAEECRDWMGPGSRGPLGHTRIRFQGKTLLAHRVAFVLAGGVIDNEVVAHTCDRGQCCQPAHLICCSVLDNNRQRDERNRRSPYLARGAASPSAKLTDRDVTAIRTARRLGVRPVVLAEMFSVSRSTVHNVLAGVYYRDAASASLDQSDMSPDTP
jgi:hypothetical protein